MMGYVVRPLESMVAYCFTSFAVIPHNAMWNVMRVDNALYESTGDSAGRSIKAWKANPHLEYVSIPIKMICVVWTVLFCQHKKLGTQVNDYDVILKQTNALFFIYNSMSHFETEF